MVDSEAMSAPVSVVHHSPAMTDPVPILKWSTSILCLRICAMVSLAIISLVFDPAWHLRSV